MLFPASNVTFKVATAKPSPDTLLSTVHKLLGWTDNASTPTAASLGKGSVAYRHLRFNKLHASQHPHLSALLSFISTAIPIPPSTYYTSRAIQDSAKGTRIVNAIHPMAPFSIPNLYYENGVRGYVRGILGVLISYEPTHPNSEIIRQFIASHIPNYKQQYKDVFIETRQVKGRMPLMRAFYVSGQSQCIDIGRVKGVGELDDKLGMLMERSGEPWIGRRRFRQGVIGVAEAVREIASAMTHKSMHEVRGAVRDGVVKGGLLSKGGKRVGNALGRSEQGRGRIRHKQQNERETETVEMIKRIGMKLGRRAAISNPKSVQREHGDGKGRLRVQ